MQVLDFIPSITDAHGKKREPSELKEIAIASSEQRAIVLCALNSTIFYWFLSVWSDCRNLNKREVLGFPLDVGAVRPEATRRLDALANELIVDLRRHSKTLDMNYDDWGKMRIQCVYPKHSKAVIDEIDRVLAKHYGFTDEELDFIINYDIKYRMGKSDQENDE